MPRILQALQDVAFSNDYGLLFLSHENDASRIPKQLEYFIARRVEGFVIFPPVPPPDASAWQAMCPFGATGSIVANTVPQPMEAGQGIGMPCLLPRPPRWTTSKPQCIPSSQPGVMYLPNMAQWAVIPADRI